MNTYDYSCTVVGYVYGNLEKNNIFEAAKEVQHICETLDLGDLSTPHLLETNVCAASFNQARVTNFRYHILVRCAVSGTVTAESRSTATWGADKIIRQMNCGVLKDLRIEPITLRVTAPTTESDEDGKETTDV